MMVQLYQEMIIEETSKDDKIEMASSFGKPVGREEVSYENDTNHVMWGRGLSVR